MARTTIGHLRELVEVLRRTRTSDGQGGFTATFQSLGEWYASINPVSFQQRTRYQQYNIDVDTEIVVQDVGGITIETKDIVVWKSGDGERYFKIEGVDNVQSLGRFVKLHCIEQQAFQEGAE